MTVDLRPAARRLHAGHEVARVSISQEQRAACRVCGLSPPVQHPAMTLLGTAGCRQRRQAQQVLVGRASSLCKLAQAKAARLRQLACAPFCALSATSVTSVMVQCPRTAANGATQHSSHILQSSYEPAIPGKCKRHKRARLRRQMARPQTASPHPLSTRCCCSRILTCWRSRTHRS